jgi:hypothetical protein
MTALEKQLRQTETELRGALQKIDTRLDDDTLSYDEWDALTDKATELTAELGKVEARIRLASAPVVKVDDWTRNFLNSFSCETRPISERQKMVFQRIGHNRPFQYNGRYFDCGRHTLVVTTI